MCVAGGIPPATSAFNAGVWLVRNTQLGYALLDEWIQGYDATLWGQQRESDGATRWTCRGCDWAGEQYEQGYFSKHVLARHKHDVHVVGWEVLNNPFWADTDHSPKVMHFPDDFRKSAPAWVRWIESRSGSTEGTEEGFLVA
jgi:hypothetical protein